MDSKINDVIIQEDGTYRIVYKDFSVVTTKPSESMLATLAELRERER